MSNFACESNMKELSMSTGRPIEELKQVVVTELMVKAAMDYVLGLWDRDVDIFLLEDVFRIMAVLQPRPLDIPKLTIAPSQ